MKTPYSILIAIFVFVLFASPVAAQVGTPWDQQINNPNRFKVLTDFGGAAVLDKETGLVWEQSPDRTQSWLFAQFHCNSRNVGGRKGWRRPTVQELASLIDPTVPFPGPTLPSGHPFSNVQFPFEYWSATTFTGAASSAWFVFFGVVVVGIDDKPLFKFVWCVRG